MIAAVAAAACTGYSYAGLEGWGRVRGVAARVQILSQADVPSGHAAVWVGVGGADAWLQVGVAVKPGGTPHLYYETGKGYRQLGAVQPGQAHDVQIAETTETTWRVTVDGKRVATVRLPNRRWEPTATGETWDDGACNSLDYELARIRSYDGTRWGKIRASSIMRDRGTVHRLADAIRGRF